MDEGEGIFKLALSEQEAGRWGEAQRLYEALLAARPELLAVRNNLAVCCLEMGEPERALSLLDFESPSLEAKTNRGNAQRALGRFGQAEAEYAVVAEKAPMDPRALSNLALAQQDQGRLGEAVSNFRRAVALAPNDASLRANLGGALLMSGAYAEGFAAQEFRLIGSATEAQMKRAGLPMWDGSALKGRRLLIWTEQGLGDSLQFLRFLKGLDGPVVLMAQQALHRLAGAIATVERVLGWDEPVPSCDVQCALLSLPRLLGIDTEEKIPPSTLSPDPLLTELWGQRLQGIKGRRIGLSWQGNAAMKADRFRSAPLSAFKSLFDLEGVSWLSLQTGVGREQIAGLDAPLLDLGAEIADLADTAAIMAHLDLVISVDSAAAHLAGSLGRPVWILVRANPDWRWPPGLQSSPWYPSARLWRQERLGDWSFVVAKMAQTLPRFFPSPG
ncbi:MAG: glycosyltransferase family protein [Alphaproteobacteria bacterium]|nr:glycosyltransferase family protein [Alphaproteobacteria bacterium]